MVEVPVLLGSARGHRQRVKRLGRTSLNIMAGRYEREVATFLKRALRDTRSFLAASRGDRCGLRARARCSPQAGTDPTERPYAPRALRREDGTARLVSRSGSCSRLAGVSQPLPDVEKDEPVVVRSLDSIVQRGKAPPPEVVKIDVEGPRSKYLPAWGRPSEAVPLWWLSATRWFSSPTAYEL
jgi:hypothetical protein